MDKIFELIELEKKRQEEGIHLIASENFVSDDVLNALGSCLTNKYSEGYTGKRYYQGNKIVDEIESLTIERGKKLLEVEHLNVQSYSGSPANSAVTMALVEPGDLICGLKLSAGGHLTHGHPNVTFSGKFFKSLQYDVEEDGRIDYDKLAKLVLENKPKLIFAGTTAYPYIIDFKRFREIADSVGAWLVADVAHILGLIVGGVHPSPVEYAHVISATTHKSLRGPRGAIIGVTKTGLETSLERFGDSMEICKKIDRAVFPGLQGGPHENNIAALGIAFEEASQYSFKEYASQIVKNAKALAEELKKLGHKVYGTENHLMVVDVGFEKGKDVAIALEKEKIYTNANTIPHDKASPFKPSGIRLGTPAMTTRGWKEEDFVKLAGKISEVIKSIK